MKKLMLLLIVAGTLLGLYFAFTNSPWLNPKQNSQQTPLVGEETDNQFTYQVKECSEEKFRSSNTTSVSEIDYQVQGSTLHIDQQLNYVCCADIELRREVTDNTIKIYEKNVGGMCKCLCTYPVSFTVRDLTSGRYNLQIYGISYEDYEHGYSLLNEISFQVD